DRVWGVVRISLGFTFLWAFLDKLIGLGRSTCLSPETGATNYLCNDAWLAGGSPTSGFLDHATSGPLAGLFQAMSGVPIVYWLFMLGLLGVGTALMLGIGMKVATVSGVAMMAMMYLSMLWPTTNPIIDEHVIYGLVLVGLLLVNERQAFGLGARWSNTGLVQRFPILK